MQRKCLVPVPWTVASLVANALLGLVACGQTQPAHTPDGEGPTNAGSTVSVANSAATDSAIERLSQPPPAQGSAPRPQGASVLTVQRVVQGITPGEYQLDAYAVELRPCPPCPPPLACRACLGDFVAVHDDATLPSGAPLVMLRVTPEQIAKMHEGARYRFEIRSSASSGPRSPLEVVSVTEVSPPRRGSE